MSETVAIGGPLELTSDDLLPLRPWRRGESQPEHASLSRFVDGAWCTITAREHLASLITTTRGLIASGLGSGDRVALMSDTRYEWLLLDEAIWNAGGGTVPIYPSSSPSQVEWIVFDSGAKVLIVGTPAQAESLAGIVYTSGTTGRPKGVVVTHRHMAAEVAALVDHPVGSAAVDGHRALMFLPMAHVLARSVAYTAAQAGATVGFWADFGTVADTFVSFRPHMILGVPRVFEKVYEGIRAKAWAGGRVPQAVFTRGERVAIEFSRAQGDDPHRSRPGLRLRAAHALFDRLLYRKVRAALGGECQYAISGGGALGERLGHFFHGVGVPAYEGYGLTETCAAITVNGPGYTRIGTVGRPIAGNDVRIADNGEIQVRGEVVTDEYWGNDTATRESIVDGWFATGDLGAIDADGYLSITGRSKEIIVTAGGKNVVPGPLEDALRSHPLVSQAMLLGEGRSFVSALITLEPDAVTHWATNHQLADTPPEELATSEELRAEIQGAVDEANSLVSRAEGVKQFRLLADDFTEETGELTATIKLKRHVIERTRADAIESIYARR